jgi:hypothetical protein
MTTHERNADTRPTEGWGYPAHTAARKPTHERNADSGGMRPWPGENGPERIVPMVTPRCVACGTPMADQSHRHSVEWAIEGDTKRGRRVLTEGSYENAVEYIAFVHDLHNGRLDHTLHLVREVTIWTEVDISDLLAEARRQSGSSPAA